MNRFLLTVLGALLCISEPSFAQDKVPFDASTSGTEENVLAFVGKKTFVRKDESWPPQDPDVIYMDSRYQARYKIGQLVAGEYDAETIDFHAYDHYGMPRFSRPKNVLIFVHDGPNTRWHSKYNFYEVHRTSDGDWAACGNAYVQNDPDEEQKEPLEAISFLYPVEVNVSSLLLFVEDEYEPDELVTDTERAEVQAELDEENAETEGLYQPPIWNRQGNVATCQMGTRVADLHKFQNESRFLPDRREKICHKRFAQEIEALEDDEDAQDALIDSCTSLLKIQNLP